MASGSPDVSNSFVQSGLWCPALRMSPIHLSPLLASGVCCPDVFSLLSLGCHHFCLPFVSQQSALQWWCLILSLFLTICFPLHLSPHSYVSPSGGVLFLFHRDFICDWPLFLFFSPIVSCCCLSSCTSTHPR